MSTISLPSNPSSSGGGVLGGGLAGTTAFPKVCNVSRVEKWNNIKYTGPLAKIPTFWIYQVQPQIVLSQQIAMGLALGNCKRYLENLYSFRAGRPGPIDLQHAFKAMCTPDCLESDNLHQSLMKYTGCNCMQLSHQPGTPLYTEDGNICRENTGRLLCDKIGFCGIWECRLGDFMCPRYEFNKKIIPLKGKYGSCSKLLISPATRACGVERCGLWWQLCFTLAVALLLLLR